MEDLLRSIKPPLVYSKSRDRDSQKRLSRLSLMFVVVIGAEFLFLFRHDF